MKKMVVKIDAYDEGSKDRVIRTVACCSGLTSITVDSKEGKLTVVGEFDELKILAKLKRKWPCAKMATFGPYDAKKEADIAAALEKKKKEETERERLEVLYRSHRENTTFPPIHHHTIVCDHDPYHGCIIS